MIWIMFFLVLAFAGLILYEIEKRLISLNDSVSDLYDKLLIITHKLDELKDANSHNK